MQISSVVSTAVFVTMLGVVPVAAFEIKDLSPQTPPAQAFTYGLDQYKSGDKTTAAIKTFQRNRKFKETGVLNTQERALLAALAKAKLAQVGWTMVDDAVTGARLGIPAKQVPNRSQTKTGTRWSSPQGQVQVETFHIREPGTTLARPIRCTLEHRLITELVSSLGVGLTLAERKARSMMPYETKPHSGSPAFTSRRISSTMHCKPWDGSRVQCPPR